MIPKLNQTVYIDFITSSPTTGAAIDADSLPTCEVFEDATDTAILSPTVTKRSGKTGNYRAQVACTTVNGFEPGKSYNVVASATVGTVAAKAVVCSFQLRTIDADDLEADIDAIKAKTDQLTFTAGKVDADVVIDASELNDIADAILKRDWTLLSGEAAYSLLSAVRILRNSWNTTGGTLTVKKEDGTTVAWTRPVMTNAAADPIVGVS